MFFHIAEIVNKNLVSQENKICNRRWMVKRCKGPKFIELSGSAGSVTLGLLHLSELNNNAIIYEPHWDENNCPYPAFGWNLAKKFPAQCQIFFSILCITFLPNDFWLCVILGFVLFFKPNNSLEVLDTLLSVYTWTF